MVSGKIIARLSLILGALLWLVFIVSDMFVMFGNSSHISSGVNGNLPNVIFNLFIVVVYLYYKYRIGKAETVNFTDLLWRIFVTGLISTIVSLVLKLFLYALSSTRLAENILVLDFVYLINLGLVSLFLVSTFIVWKRLILYQKSKFLVRIWNTFEYTLLISLVYSALPFEIYPNLTLYYVVMLIIMGLFLSVNMRWVAYLNFKQKWKSILLIFLTLLYLGYFSSNLYGIRVLHEFNTDLWDNVFLLALIAFIFIYALFSLLVILFNLPTSSVFEQKLEEVVNFQKLSQSVQTDQSEEQVYNILLESSVSAVLADAAWIEMENHKEENELVTYNINKLEIEQVKRQINHNTIKSDRPINRLKGIGYKSIVMFSISVQGQQIGSLALLKEVVDGFDKESANILKTFVTQAEVSIENSRLINQALENERYKEELKIAKDVQMSLLPQQLHSNSHFDIQAFSVSADEVGGDYYDTYKIHDGLYAVIIGDVSGKGTSAAFHMSQMKGVFQSLAQLGMSSKEFLINANNAISNCLEKASFITVTYFLINTVKKEIEFARAGHCPTIYHNAQTGKTDFFTNKGLGLGILRTGDFHKYIHVNKIPYHIGDVILLYTDGISEARNADDDEYGYDRIKEVLHHNRNESPKIIQDRLIEDLYQFSGSDFINDDYTTLVIKFNE